MKAYSLGNNRRITISLSIMAFAFALSGVVVFAFDHVPGMVTHLPEDRVFFTILEWAGILMPVSLPICFWAFNRFVWRWWGIRYLIDIPDLNGTWMGSLERREFLADENEPGKANTADETGVPVVLHIRQCFFVISVQLENTETSTRSGYTRSSANTIGLLGDGDSGFELDFTFGLGSLFGVNTLRLSSDAGEDVLSGEYVSSFPRKGKFTVTRLRNGQTMHKGKVRKINSLAGEEYLGILVPHAQVDPFHHKWASLFPHDRLHALEQNREERDGHLHHLTVVSPPEYAKLDAEQIAQFHDKVVAYALTGIGRIKRSENETWYVTAIAQHITFLRAQVGLPPRDLHVTLGFDPQDIYDHPKDECSWVPSVN